MDEEISRKDQELQNKEKLLHRYAQQNDDMKKENKALSNKLKQLQNGPLKELQQKVHDKDGEIEVLKEMVRSAQLQLKSKENENSRLMIKIKRMMKEGYVEKMKVQGHLRKNGSPLNIHDLDHKLN